MQIELNKKELKELISLVDHYSTNSKLYSKLKNILTDKNIIYDESGFIIGYYE